MTTALHVDVLMVNYRTGDLTRRAAAAVAGPGVDVWVWDNSGDVQAAPPDGLAGLFGDGRNIWFAPANNALARHCDGEFILLLNPDVELAHDGLLELVRFMGTHPRAWAAAPRLLNVDGTDQDYLQRLPDLQALLADRLPPLRRVLRRAYGRFMAADVDLRCEQVVVQPPAACLLLRRAALAEPLFDPAYRLFFNDTDLARRMNVSGECWLVPSVTAVHLRGESFRREKPSSGYFIAREYDKALLRYARNNVRGWWVLLPVIVARLVTSWCFDHVQACTVAALRRASPRTSSK